MARNPLTEVGERLGWFAYLTVMGGGIPFWPVLFVRPEALTSGTGEPGGSANGRYPFAGSAPYEYRRDQHDPIAA